MIYISLVSVSSVVWLGAINTFYWAGIFFGISVDGSQQSNGQDECNLFDKKI